MAGEVVLIVDDNPSNLRLVGFLLHRAGYQVLEAMDAVQALQQLELALPDLVLVDIQLPGMNGLELTRRLRANPRTQQLVVAAVTAYAMKGDEVRARVAGCDAYYTKPLDTRCFGQQIAELVAIHHARQRGDPAFIRTDG
jgi:two-component system cell cycle response regulator